MMLAPELAARLGLKKLRRDWRGSCPSCGYPAAFSVRAGDGDRALAWCASCQDRDGLASALARITAGAWAPPVQQTPESVEEARTRKQEAARKLWSGSVAVTGTLVDTYLSARCLAGLASYPALRYRDDCHHPQGGRMPAMVALVVDVRGTPIAVHRTYLDRRTCRKAIVEPTRASLGPIWTGAIRLHPIQPRQPLIVAEVIETAGSAALMIGAPAWAAVSAGNLQFGLMLPPEVREVVIAADPDGPGEQAARGAARRWQIEGRTVRIARTGRAGADFNDLLMDCPNNG